MRLDDLDPSSNVNDQGSGGGGFGFGGGGGGGLGGLLDSFITVTTSTAEALADLQPLSLAISSHVSEAGTVGISGAISQELQHHSLTL